MATIPEAWRRLPTAWKDAVLAGLVGFAGLSAIATAEEVGARDADFGADLLMLTHGAAFLLRRIHPLAVLAGVVALTATYYAADYPGGPPLVALCAALFLGANSGWTRVCLPVSLLFAAMGVSWRLIAEGEQVFSVMLEPALLLGAVLLGDALRSRRLLAEEVEQRLARAEQERERETRRRIGEERLRIAHELHDVLAHTLAVAGVQANVASEALNDDHAAAVESLRVVQDALRSANRELRATVGVLREEASPLRSPLPGPSELPSLLEGFAQAGIDVRTEVKGEPRELTPAAGLALYRVVQESLTNVVRHSSASCVNVSLSFERSAVSVSVTDDGRDVSTNSSEPGFGLTGMRERVEALAGTFAALATPDGGFEVRAWIPDHSPAGESL